MSNSSVTESPQFRMAGHHIALRIMSVLVFLAALSLLIANPIFAANAVPEFAGVEIYLIDTPIDAVTDLSGLALCDGRLLAVSDKNNDTVFALTIADGRASIAPAFTIPLPPIKEVSYHAPADILYKIDGLKLPGRQDWEGIACRDDDVYLISERKNAILAIHKNASRWLPVDWYEALYKQGFLHEYNAFVEGVAVYDDGHFLIAMERNPRGIIELQRSKAPDRHAGARWSFKGSPLSNDLELRFRSDSADIADIVIYRDAMYTLERNASAVCRRNPVTLQANSCYSYADIENSALYRYSNSKYGLGEGLAVDDRWLYLVFDNNNEPRLSDPSDRRSLLLRIPLPVAWQTHRP